MAITSSERSLQMSVLEPSIGDILTLGRFSSRHSTLGVDQINHQFLGADNGSSTLVYLIPALSVGQIILSFQKAPIDKVPVPQVQHQVPYQFKTPLVESEEDPASLQEILQESIELLVRSQVVSSLTYLQSLL
ncbi:hypothetical protein Tco_0534785 [Tanacetum coccineum]